MKLVLRAGGVLRSGPERDLTNDYLNRARHLSRNLGFSHIEEQQIDLRSAKTRADETRLVLPKDMDKITGLTVILDERGKALTSRLMAKQLANWRDDGQKQINFVIGGADGFESELIPASVIRWAFGPQTWPHKLVRVMMAEQIYRSLSILASTPYHRD